jgi:SAM-dependent methyltransferase
MTQEPEKSRQEMWDERHAAREPIESPEPDPELVTVASALAPGRSLDLAAGDGRNAIWLATKGWSSTAVDFSQVALDRAAGTAARLGVSVDLVQADLLAWQPVAASVDLVVIMFLHLPADERRAVFAKAAVALAPGGTALIVGHDRLNVDRDVPGPKDPAYLYTPDEVAADLPGLSVVGARRVDHDLGDGRVSTDTVVVARRPL